ncbi:MAG: aromatic amino acid lyase [Patescibacteria group bacterium]|nr:aromatic amino acid lyase [Patescibacteria group bacterium]
MKPKNLSLNGSRLGVSEVVSIVANRHQKVELDTKTLNVAAAARKFFDTVVEKNGQVIYGLNTGFGPMASYILAHDQLLDLQQNLILSHAVGLGRNLKDDYVLAAMVVRLNTLIKGQSGVSVELLQHLQKLINFRVIPVVPEHGAVGTSGDLVQLAHIALAILGKGEVVFKGEVSKASAVFKILGIKPYKLKTKEGLALINGTSMMAGIAALVCQRGLDLLSLGLRNACLALELVRAYSDSFGEKLHAARPHPGQVTIAAAMRKMLKSSSLIRDREILNKNANHGKTVNHISESVQEFYSLRCVAQILGPIQETLAKAWSTTEIEVNSVTDNPIIDLAGKKFLHGGNFHGDYIAANMDQLKAALVKLTMLSERRLNFFLNHKINGTFPPFLNLDTPGLTLGLQGLQFVATSTTAHSQTLAYPMHLHSISTNGDNQDVVSMGTDAALLADQVADNAFIVLTIELIALCQAVDYLKVKNQLSAESKKLYELVRQTLPAIIEDRHAQPQLQALVDKIKTYNSLGIPDLL